MNKRRVAQIIKKIPMNIALLLIKVYRMAISPLLPNCCRFTPTCSEYGMIAIQRYGFCKGSVLAVKRILRCRPGGGKGYDPVP